MRAKDKLAIGAIFGLTFIGSVVSSPASAVSLITGTGDPLTAIPGGNQITFETVTPGEFTSLAIQGVTFAPDPGYAGTPTSGTGEYVNSDYAGNYNTSGQSLQNTYNTDAFAALLITFANPVSAFAFNWGAADTGWLLDSYDGTTLLGTVSIAPTFSANAGTYDGVQSTSADITSAVLYVDIPNLATTLPDYVFIDNFTDSAVATTPLPSTWTMLIAGLVGIGFLLHRGKRKNDTAVAAI